jgi:predicted transglutaminase-like cysteine proteinase
MDGLFRAIAVVALALTACACAAPGGPVGAIDPRGEQFQAYTPSAPGLMAATPMPASNVAVAVPPGFISFCMRFPAQCQAPENGPHSVAIDAGSWLVLETVNQSVNRAIRPMDDQRHYGREEYWNIPTDGFGDCEDYALTKRHDLIAAGIPINALRVAIVLTRREERHAVLTVTTDHGDYVLDNLTDHIVSWEKSDYTWIERQDPTKAWGWVALGLSPDTDKIAAIASRPLGATR